MRPGWLPRAGAARPASPAPDAARPPGPPAAAPGPAPRGRRCAGDGVRAAASAPSTSQRAGAPGGHLGRVPAGGGGQPGARPAPPWQPPAQETLQAARSVRPGRPRRPPPRRRSARAPRPGTASPRAAAARRSVASEQEVALGHGQLGGRGGLDRLAVDADGERVRVDLDLGQRVVAAAGPPCPGRARPPPGPGRGAPPSRSASPASSAAGRDERQRRPRRPPRRAAPHIGRGSTGCGVGIDALASPIAAQATIPPLSTACGRTPKNAGSQSTRSASLPGSHRADLGRRARARPPGRSCTWRRSAGPAGCPPGAPPTPSPGSAPRRSFIACAVCQVRITISPIRPIAWESEPIMEIAPRSCRMSSAAIVVGRIRDSANARSSGTRGVQVMADHEHVEVLVHRVHRVRAGRVGRGRQHVRVRGHGDDVRRVPAARALRVVRVDAPARRSRPGSTRRTRPRSACRCAARPAPPGVGGPQAGVDRGRGRSPVLVQLEPARARPQAAPRAPPARPCCPCRAARCSPARRRRPPASGPGARRPGVTVVALVPSAGPGAAADQRGDARAERLVERLRADQVHVAVDARPRSGSARCPPSPRSTGR